MGDEGLSKLSNVAVTVIAARSLSVEEFGLFGLAYLTYIFAAGLGRALAGDVIVIGNREREGLGGSGADAGAGATVVLGAAGALALVVGGLIFPQLLSAFLVLGLALPALLLQDLCRYVAMSRLRPKLAALIDALWAVLAIPALFLLSGQLTPHGAAGFLAVWALTGLASAAVGMLLLGIRPRVRQAMRWMADHRTIIPALLAELGASRGSNYITIMAITGVIGLSATAGLRGIQVLFGPLHMVLIGLVSAGTAEARRWHGTKPRNIQLLAYALSTAATVTFLALGVALWVIPDRLGAEILGSTWPEASKIVVPITLGRLAMALAVGPLVALRASGLVVKGSFAKVLGALLSVLFAVAGAILFGLTAAAYGIALGSAVTTIGLWSQFFRHRGVSPPPTQSRGDGATASR